MEHGAIFYVRMKAGNLVEFGSNKLKVSELSGKDTVICLGDMQLRLVHSDDPETGEP